MSSGAANKPYTAWATYGSSKAAVNSISTHLAVEEPDITSVTIVPGRVDTDMQSVLRASGKDVMDKAQYDSFVDAFQQGRLLKPEQPGHVIAKFVAQPRKDLSGNCLKYVWPCHNTSRRPLTEAQLELGRAGRVPRVTIPATRVQVSTGPDHGTGIINSQVDKRLQNQSKDEKLLVFSTWGFSISME